MPEPLPRLRQPARRHRALRQVPAAPLSQGLRQPDPGLLVILLGQQRQRHREIHHDVRRELPPFRFAPFPVASTASSTASRGTQDASTPREIQSLKRPSATLPACVITRDHAGNQPDTPHATRQGNQDQLKLSGIGRRRGVTAARRHKWA